MSWTVSKITDTFDVTDPDSGDSAAVTIKRLSEGERLAVAEFVSGFDVESVSVGEFQGRVKREYLRRSIVESKDSPITAEIVDDLDPRVSEEIYEHVKLHNPGIWPDETSTEAKLQRADELAMALDLYLHGEGVTRDGIEVALASYQGTERPT